MEWRIPLDSVKSQERATDQTLETEKTFLSPPFPSLFFFWLHNHFNPKAFLFILPMLLEKKKKEKHGKKKLYKKNKENNIKKNILSRKKNTFLIIKKKEVFN